MTCKIFLNLKPHNHLKAYSTGMWFFI